jgi:hypothetical protein
MTTLIQWFQQHILELNEGIAQCESCEREERLAELALAEKAFAEAMKLVSLKCSLQEDFGGEEEE